MFSFTGFKTSREEWKEREISTHVHLEWMAAPTKECDLEYFKSPDINKLVGKVIDLDL